MKKAFKYFLLLSFALLPVISMAAQEPTVEAQDTSAKRGLPLAPRDSSVKNGVLPNGMSYYIVANPTTSGVADFALVQRTGTNDLGSKAYDVARGALTALPRLQESPQSFLMTHSVSPDKHGYVKVTEDATLYHFGNVVLAQESVDSVLLVIMDIVDRGTSGKDSLWMWYAPADQAVIVSGDVDTTMMAVKLQMLSYMTPYREPQKREEALWQNRETPNYKVVKEAHGQYATISASWEAPKPPRELMNTVQPAIYSMFINELGILAQERMIQRLRNEGVPAVAVSCDYVGGQQAFDAERLTVSATVAPEHIRHAVEVIASTMSSLDRRTATVYEFQMSKSRYFRNLEKSANKVVRSNSECVAQCASSFLYNAPISSPKEVYSFLKYRNLEVETELRYFNDIASALLDVKRNLSVSCLVEKHSSITEGDLQSIFEKAWNSNETAYVCEDASDNISLVSAGEPLKVKSIKADPISGGRLWTFSNGFKVIYKRQESGRRMYFALALNGGYGNIPGLSKGEGAYVSDYLRMSKIAGLDCESFYRALEEYDVTITPTSNLSNTIIEGSVPQTRVDLMLQALLAFVNAREYDKRAFEYYLSCQDVATELMKGGAEDRIVAVDSLLWPGYGYSQAKVSGSVSDEFPAKVEGFWKHQSGKTNDGVLILVGDIEETRLRKLIQNYVGAFGTTDRVYSRVNINSQPVSGHTVYTSKGEKNSVDVAMTMRLPFSAENYMASYIAAAVLEQMISKAVSGTGMYLKFAHDCRIYPYERFNVIITLEEADLNGLAHSVKLQDASEVLAIVRRQLANLEDLELCEDDILKYKDILKGQMELNVSDPRYWVHAIAMRHLDGKDLTSSFESRIDEITAEKVLSILSSLSSTSRVEYIIEK